jgi:hypothetical protein
MYLGTFQTGAWQKLSDLITFDDEKTYTLQNVGVSPVYLNENTETLSEVVDEEDPEIVITPAKQIEGVIAYPRDFFNYKKGTGELWIGSQTTSFIAVTDN